MHELEQVLDRIHNWFRVGVYPGTYTIEDGEIVLPFVQSGQYFRICGSIFNDGVYRYGPEMESLHDETFTGSIWALAIPRALLEAVKDEAAVDLRISQATAAFAESNFTSESFGGYSYSKDATGQLSALTAEKEEIAKRINQWRKVNGT